jgi:hypothetical protein
VNSCAGTALSKDEWRLCVTLESEDEIKRALEIDSWRNLSRDKVIKFAAMMPDMDKEVALGIIAQLPVFTRFSVEALGALRKAQDSVQASNNQSQGKVHDAYSDIREALKAELKKENLTPEERQYLLDLLMETGNRESKKDTENKRFLDGLFNKTTVATGVALVGALVFVGGKVLVQRGNDESGSHNT